jgi:NTP pyrophosphatase (non-canonical NTP hydrolase)
MGPKIDVEKILLRTECNYDGITVDPRVLVMLNKVEMFYGADMSDDYEDVFINPRIAHGDIGIHTEMGELYDAYKKHWFYRQPLNEVNVLEEIGDVMWYVLVLEDELGRTFYGTRAALNELAEYLGSTLNACMVKVLNKLKIRYPDKYSDYLADNRDLEAEYKELEK